MLAALGVPAGPINDVAKHWRIRMQARHGAASEHATEGTIQVLGPVAKFSRTPATVRSAPPPSAITPAVLRAMLGYDMAQIAGCAAKII